MTKAYEELKKIIFETVDLVKHEFPSIDLSQVKKK